MKEYIWFKNGKEIQRSKDPEGKFITRKITGYNTHIKYYYYYGSLESESFFKDDKLHREGDKPACIYYDKDGNVRVEYYYKNGLWHRDNDKPAAIRYYEDGDIETYYYKDGVEYKPTTIA